MRPVRFTANNEVKLLQCGAEFFPALLAEINAAEREIHLETYIFADDDTGSHVKRALLGAAERGVTVNIIVDWIGTGRAASNALRAEFEAGKVNFRIFNPWFMRGIARTHRKICVIDRQTALLGGLNINDDFYSDDNSRRPLPAPRWDIAASITGPLVDVIHKEAESQWRRLGTLKLAGRWELFRSRRATPPVEGHGPMQAGLVVRDNLRNRRTIQRAYLKALGGARHKALLANPYFAPGRKLRTALSRAAERGVEVTLLLGVGQFRMQDTVAQSFYPKLLKKGVKIVEYNKTQLHAKVAVVDNDWATLGSSNYDGLSLFVNQEANIVVRDVAFCAALRAHIEGAVADGVPVDPLDYANIPWHMRVWYATAYWMYRSLLKIITIGRGSE
jgi:cardiolipin synthase